MERNYCNIKDLNIYISDGNYSEKYPRSNEFVSSGVPFIRANNIVNDTISDEDLYYISEEKHKELLKGHVKSGDVLLTTRGNIGEVAIVPSRHNDSNINAQIVLLRISDNTVNKQYFLYALQSKNVKRQFDSLQTGTALKQLPIGRLLQVKLRIAEINEQRKIADIIHKCKELIFKRKWQLQKLDELVKARFVEMFDNIEENSKKYLVCDFAEIVEYMCDIGSNGANKTISENLDMKDEEDYAMMVRFLNFTKNDFCKDVKYISREAYDFFRKSQVFGGELIICKIGSAGQSYIMPKLNRPVSLGLNQILVRVKENILMGYLYQYLHSDYGERLIAGCINGAVTKSITKTELKKIPVVLPPLEEQTKFVDFVQQIDKSKLCVQNSLGKLETLQKALMQKYFG